jgi:hypothetical protein
MKKYIVFLLFASCLMACGKKEVSVKKYYFPYASFTESKVYKYTEAKDPNAVLYWRLNTTPNNMDTLLVIEVFNAQLQLTTAFLTRITETGAQLKQMLINPGDTANTYRCTIKQNEAFNWQIKPKQKLFVSFTVANQTTNESDEVVIERSFEDKKAPVNFNGKEYTCLVMKEASLINHVQPNRTITEEQERTSYFAEGIGLIQFETFNFDGSSTRYMLEKIMTEAEWKSFSATPDSSGTATR